MEGHTKDGRPCFVVPGGNGRVYWTDTRDCTCPDRRQRDETCKHIRAVRLWKLQHDAQSSAPAPKRAGCRVCTQPLPAGVISGECDACADVGLWFDGVGAVKAAFGSRQGAVVELIGA